MMPPVVPPAMPAVVPMHLSRALMQIFLRRRSGSGIGQRQCPGGFSRPRKDKDRADRG